MNTNFVIETNVPKPVRTGTFTSWFIKIPVKGQLVVTPSEGETLDKISTKARNAVANFKNSHPDYNLSVHIFKEENAVKIYRDETPVKA